MLPLRAYLLIKSSYNEWNVTVHRDLDSIVSTWASFNPNPNRTGVVHIGFTRPDTSEFNHLTNSYPGRILLTAPAKYVFERIGTCAPAIAGTVDNIPVYVVILKIG